MRNALIGMGAVLVLTVVACALTAHAVLAPGFADGVRWITPYETRA